MFYMPASTGWMPHGGEADEGRAVAGWPGAPGNMSWVT
jgi:hypothetical protein